MRLFALLPALLLSGTSMAAPAPIDDLEERAKATKLFSVTLSQSQSYQIPASAFPDGATTAVFEVACVGGEGGAGNSGTSPGGLGGYASNRFLLYRDATYEITIGGTGADGKVKRDGSGGGGGGGGATIFSYNGAGYPVRQFLLIGGGGGGGGNLAGARGGSADGTDAQSDQPGNVANVEGGGGRGAGKASFDRTNYAQYANHGGDGYIMPNNLRAPGAPSQGGINGGGGGASSGGGGAGWQGGDAGGYGYGGAAGRSHSANNGDYPQTTGNDLVRGTPYYSTQTSGGGGYVRISQVQ